MWRDKPRHDWASHGVDAFQVLGVCWREMREEEPPEDLETKMPASLRKRERLSRLETKMPASLRKRERLSRQPSSQRP